MKESTTYEQGTYDQETFRPNDTRLELPSPRPAPTQRPGVKRTVFALASAAPLVLAAFALYVWPTPYQTYSQNGNTLRVNRFTGKTQALAPTGWGVPSNQSPESLDANSLSKLSVDDSLITRGNLHTRIYNGTSSRLSGVTLLVTILNKDKTMKLSRPYLAHPEDAGEGGPYGDDGFGARCNVPIGPGETWRITVAGAIGTVMPGLAAVTTPATASVTPPGPMIAAAPAPAKLVLAKAVPTKPAPPVAAPPAKAASPAQANVTLPTHSLPLSAGSTPPHPVPPLASAIKVPTAQPLPRPPSAITPAVVVDPAKTGGLTPLQMSTLQQRYDTYKRDGKFATDPKIQAWGLAALAKNVVHDDNQADLSKVPTAVLEDSLHMINTYKPADFLR